MTLPRFAGLDTALLSGSHIAHPGGFSDIQEATASVMRPGLAFEVQGFQSAAYPGMRIRPAFLVQGLTRFVTEIKLDHG